MKKKICVIMILLVFFNYVNINLIVLERKDINEYIILKESAELDNLLKKMTKHLYIFTKRTAWHVMILKEY